MFAFDWDTVPEISHYGSDFLQSFNFITDSDFIFGKSMLGAARGSASDATEFD